MDGSEHDLGSWHVGGRGVRRDLVFPCLYILVAAGCGHSANATIDASVDVQPFDARVYWDATPWVPPADDASLPPPEQFEMCGEPYFMLPILSMLEPQYKEYASHQGRHVVYSRYGPSREYKDLVHFDLETCVKTQLTTGQWAWGNSIVGDHVVWLDSHVFDEEGVCRLHTMELPDGEDLCISDNNLISYPVHTNGEHVVYELRNSTDWEHDLYGRYILQRLDGTDTVTLSPAEDSPSWNTMTRDRVIWADWPESGAGQIIHVRSLSDGIELEMGTPVLGGAPYIWASGDYAIWIGPTLPGGIQQWMLGDLRTGDSTSILSDAGVAFAYPNGRIGDDLVGFRTTNYRPAAMEYGWDLELFDVLTGTRRRMTTYPNNINIVGVSVPWVVTACEVGDYIYEFWALHLERLGVIDDHGRLLPGPPVIAPH